MTEAEMKAAARRIAEIERTREALIQARGDLAFANANKKDKIWTASFEMKRAEWSGQRSDLRIDIDFGVIQQACVSKCARLERELILLGGKLP